MITIFATIFVFGLIVLIHELGHFITAKLCGMRVDEFAIGFGPKLVGFQRGETLYSIRLIPLGGFNRIAGMMEDEEGAELDERAFLKKPLWQRFIVISAGAVFNFLLAIVLFFGLYASVGTQSVSPGSGIGSIVAGSPAEGAHLEAGDRIISIDNKPVSQWTDIGSNLQGTAMHAVDFTVERQGQLITSSIIPKDENGRTVIGIMPEIIQHPMSLDQAAIHSVTDTGKTMYAMVDGLLSMIEKGDGKNLSGPVGVAQMAGQVAAVGFVPLVSFTALLSINLGVVNLFPLPVLDGGHLILIILEGIRGKKLPAKALQYIQLAGIALLILLFLYATTQDLGRLVGSFF